jgi:hypothetical protein
MGIKALPRTSFCYVKGAFFLNNPVFDKKTKHQQVQKDLKAIACKAPKLGYLKHHPTPYLKIIERLRLLTKCLSVFIKTAISLYLLFFSV